MKYLAVIFDLFGTLADNFSTREYDEALAEMATILSLRFDDFKKGWYSSSKARNPLAPQGIDDRVAYICTELAERREPEQIRRAAGARYDYIRRVMKPRPESIEVISYIKKQGHKIGLISDCSDEIPVIWPETPLAPLFDAAVFSCVAGFRKPDPRIYSLAMEKLSVPPQSCLYIGDGGSQELSGALKAGMNPVLIRLDAESNEEHLSSRERWNGQTVRSLKEILDLI
jgi:putative hydrolase of the HAD superfamily